MPPLLPKLRIRRCALFSTLLPIVFVLGGCAADTSAPAVPDAVTEIDYAVAHGGLVVNWTPVQGAVGYLVELQTPASVRTARASDGETTVTFEAVAPGDYQVTVYTVYGGGRMGRGKRIGVRVPTESELVDSVTAMLPTSLHGTAKGMAYWYDDTLGFGLQIGVPYAGLRTCSGCHVFNTALTGAPADQPCLACHATRADDPTQPDYEVVDDAKCLKCHGRQAAEIAMNLSDVHRTAGMKCGDCHTGTEAHGGSGASTMFDVLTARCDNCHRSGYGHGFGSTTRARSIPATESHTLHRATVACQACHMGATVSCYNCHLADEIQNGVRVAYRRFADWTFLGNYRGKVYPLNLQSIQYEGATFNAWGPFNGHTVTSLGRTCGDCHANANLHALDSLGALRVTQWDSTAGTLNHVSGVIPLPPDFTSRLLFDYLTKGSDGAWSFVEQGPDRTQMLYATPLTQTQMDRLRQPR